MRKLAGCLALVAAVAFGWQPAPAREADGDVAARRWREAAGRECGGPAAPSRVRVSPVTRLSPPAARPETTMPSTGTRSPARTSTLSPGRTAAAGTIVTAPAASSRLAVSAFSAARFEASMRVLRRMAWSR